MFRFEETDIPMNFTNKLNTKELAWEPTDTADFYKVVMFAISDFLKKKKQKGQEVGFEIRDINGVFKLGAIVGYEEPSEEDNAGNWTYAFTFSEDDMKQCTLKFDIGDAAFQYVFGQDAYEQQRMKFDSYQQVYGCLIDSAECLYEFLDQNASETTEVELELEGYFIAKVTIEDGEKVMSLTPDGAMKTLVKGDAVTEEAA